MKGSAKDCNAHGDCEGPITVIDSIDSYKTVVGLYPHLIFWQFLSEVRISIQMFLEND